MPTSIEKWLNDIYQRADPALADIRAAQLYQGFWRQFSVSGLSSASQANYNLGTHAGPHTLLLTPYPGEEGLVVRQVEVNITDTAAWTQTGIGAQNAPSPALQFRLFRQGVEVERFEPGNNNFGFTSNLSFVRGSDEWKFEQSNLMNAGARFFWRFSNDHRGPILLLPGDDLRWVLPNGATLINLPGFMVSASGIIYVNSPE